MANKYQSGGRTGSGTIMIVVILAAIIIFFKPILKLFKLGSDTFGGAADIVTTLLTNVGIVKSDDVLKHERIVKDETSFYYDAFWHKYWKHGDIQMSAAEAIEVEKGIVSFFGFFDDDEEGLYKFINNVFKTQAQFSQFCGNFFSRNGQRFDLALTSGVLLSGLTQKEMAKITNIILAKPKTKKR